ncbi:MAG: pyruvate ferredoxin oxidoreductase [Hadesarchaea archaeon]|nr:MAG: pyruvate ferredoxin oxidoreductase [Hadesarchaea archaeon]HDI12505.1 pyruvate ferredoxin oxidoreductase [Hadesarchaea archaeon]
MTGNDSAALAAKLARVKVISAYPITPQTTIVEKLSEFVANGELDAEYIKVESEHSALSACVGAAATGVRTFTATSSQGLMLMSEILFVASGLRLPIVMTNVNRSLSAPLSIWCDQQDSVAVRDSGWIQLYCENNQEILDSTIQAFRIAEETLLPVMVCFDGYILSHTAEPVDVPEQSEVDGFLPQYNYPYALDPEHPGSIGAVGVPDYYEEFRFMLQEEMLKAKEKILEVGKIFAEKFGRKYGLLERYRTEDAEIILLTMGSLAGSLKDMVDEYRQHGERVGLVKLRSFRPFPVRELKDAVGNAKAVAVLEKDVSPGLSGALFSDLSTALINSKKSPLLMNFICGLAGRDVSPLQIREAVKSTLEAVEAGEVKNPVRWLGLRETLMGLR